MPLDPALVNARYWQDLPLDFRMSATQEEIIELIASKSLEQRIEFFITLPPQELWNRGLERVPFGDHASWRIYRLPPEILEDMLYDLGNGHGGSHSIEHRRLRYLNGRLETRVDLLSGAAGPVLPEPPVERPGPLRHIPWESIPRPWPGNERQRILLEISADESEERVNTLLDPVTMEAIEHPRLLTGDTSGQYFEYHTLMALPRTADGTFAHPLTRGRYSEDHIVDASVTYEELFNKTVAEIKAEQAARPGPA